MTTRLSRRSFQLVAFDLDGTLLGSDLQMSQRVCDAVARMRDGGVAGCLVTGRMYRASLPFARRLGFEAPIVCYQGAAIVDPTGDRVLYDRPLDNALVLETISAAANAGKHVQLYRNDEYYAESRNACTDLYAKVSGVEPVVVASLREAFAYSAATKAVVIAEEDEARDLARTLQRRFAGRAYVTRSLPQFVEIVNARVDKGEALKFVANVMGVPLEATMAIGDSWNDAPLLQAAGFGVAMGSAPSELQAVADAVVADASGDGVAEALERFLAR